MQIIELYSEDNELIKFRLLDSFKVDEEDYVVLEELEDSTYYYIFQAKESKDGQLEIFPIDSDVELAEIDKLYQELLDDLERE